MKLIKRQAIIVSFLCIEIIGMAGAQNFAPPTNYPTGVLPDGSAAVDFNNDGNIDVVVGNSGTTTLTLFLGHGDGSLGSPSTIQVGLQPIAIAAGDFNADGNLDLAVSGVGGPFFQILLGNGDGTFQAPIDITVPGLSTSAGPLVLSDIAVGDVNSDKKMDIAVATSNGAAVFLNDGAGNFSFSGNVMPGRIVQNLSLADFNRDGLLDMVVMLTTGAPNTFLSLGKGDGTFQTPAALPVVTANPDGIVVADLNNDGLPDVIVDDNGVFGTNPGSVQIALQKSDGTFISAASLTIPGPTGIVAADLDGDGNIDIAAATETVNGNQNFVEVFRGNGDGTFSAPIQFPAAAGVVHPITAHLTNTTALDLISSAISANEISVFVNHGSNTLSLLSSPNPSTIGQSVLLTATITPTFPGSGSFSGSLIFADGRNTLGTSGVNSSGSASLKTAFASVGNHSLQAVFSGNTSFVSSSASITQVVNKASPSVTLNSSINPSSFGESVIFSTTVSGISGAPTPTGTVNLLDGSSIILSGALDTAGKTALSTSSLGVGSHVLTAQYSGDANNTSATSSPLTQTINNKSSATTLATAPNPSNFGQSITLTAAVSSSWGASGTPTGSVTFADGTTAIGSSSLDANGKGTLTTTSLAVGTHSVSAVYAGDSNFAGSTSATVSQIVNKAATVTMLTSSPNPSAVGQSVTFSATVTTQGSSGSPTGAVRFSDGTTTLGIASLDSTGKANLSSSSLSTGTHSIVASYAGDSNFSASSSSATSQVVNKAASLTTITASPNPSVFGQSVNLTAIVAPSGSASASPTGAVTFTDGTIALGTAAVDNAGKAVLMISSLSVGAHNISANYSGDGNFSSSTSGTLSQTVDRNSVSVTVTSAPNPSTFGQAVTFTVKVVPIPPGGAPGTATPGGTITFSDGTSLLGSAALDNTGTATLTISTLTAGSHTITAVYAGDANFSKGSSSPYPQTVKKIPTRISLAASMNPTTNTSTIMLTASVLAIAGAPTGSVTFFDGAQQLGSSTIDLAGNAVLPVASLSTGSHTLTAAYTGDDSFASSQSSPIFETVADSHDAVMLTSSANPQIATAAVTFSATVTTAAGGLVSSGTVTFKIGQSLLAVLPVINSKASLTTSSLPVGTDSISAMYQAGASPGPTDGSATLVETINPVTPIVVVGGSNEDFTLSIKPGKAQVNAGNTLSAQVALVPVNGLTGVVNVSCTGVPQGSTCAVTPNFARFDGGNSITATLTISTTGPGAPVRRPHPPSRGKGRVAVLQFLPIAFGCVLIPVLKKRRSGFIALVVLTGLLTGCGGTTFQSKPLNTNTPPGNYRITVQGVSGSLAHSAQIELTVR